MGVNQDLGPNQDMGLDPLFGDNAPNQDMGPSRFYVARHGTKSRFGSRWSS